MHIEELKEKTFPFCVYYIVIVNVSFEKKRISLSIFSGLINKLKTNKWRHIKLYGELHFSVIVYHPPIHIFSMF